MPPETLADLIASIGITPPQTPQQRFYQRPRLPGDALMQPGDVQPAAPSQIGGYLIDRSLARHADQEAQRGAQIMQRNGVDPTGNAPRSLPQVLGDVGNMAFEGTGLPAAKRAIQHTYNSMQMGVGDQSMAEARAGTDNALMAGLNVALMAGPHMLPELPARRLPVAPVEEPATPLPQNPTRDLGYSNGSLLPVRPREPFRQSLVGGSADLADAALPPRRLPQQAQQAAPDARASGEDFVGANRNPSASPDGGGFDTGNVAYRGLSRPYDPADGGNYQTFTSSEADAREYGQHVIAANLRRGRNLAIDGGGNNFNSISTAQLPPEVRARLHPSVGAAATTDEVAHAARAAGYDSVSVRNVHDNRWGERPSASTPTRTIDIVFDTKNIRPVDYTPTPTAAETGGKVRLSDADRALLAELEADFPASNAPARGGTDRLVAPTQTRTVKQNFPADERRGLRSYQSQNVDVTIERKSGDAAAHVGWALRGQPPQSLAARAQLEQEGIAASVDALKQDAAANPRAAYKFQGFNQALMRRYRRIVDEHAASAGFDVSMEDGSLVLRRKPASQSNPPNGGGSDPAKPPDPALPPRRRPRT